MTEIEKFTKSGTPVVRCTYNIILADKKLYQSERIDYRDETTTIFASLRGRKKKLHCVKIYHITTCSNIL